MRMVRPEELHTGSDRVLCRPTDTGTQKMSTSQRQNGSLSHVVSLLGCCGKMAASRLTNLSDIYRQKMATLFMYRTR